MITIAFSDIKIETVGHAKTNVCSAVSCLIQTLDIWLCKNGIEHESKVESGHCFVKVARQTELSQIGFDFVIYGLTDIARSYPNDCKML